MPGLKIDSEASNQSLFQLRLENFRLFRDSGWLDIAPFTCVVGRNSSGKSSVLSALLLLKQSIENEVFGSAVTPLALSGEYCDLGQFRDLVHNHVESREIAFSFLVHLSRISSSRLAPSSSLVEVSTPRPSRVLLNPYRLYFPNQEKLPDEGTLEVKLTFSSDQPFGPSLSRCEMKFSEFGSVRYVRTISGERKQHWRTYSDVSFMRPLVFYPNSRSFFPLVTHREKIYDKLSPVEKGRSRRVLLASAAFFPFLENLLRRSEMIGPFRQPPSRRYTFGGFGANRSGPSGEQAVDLLITEALIKKGAGRPLLAAVSYWLKALKLADNLGIRDVTKRLNLFEVDVKLAGRRIRTNLVDVGFGVSQVLPVLVQGLLMKRGGIYFVQEPEIHLHPDAQAGLADFFIYLACQGVTSIVETHSEYLLLHLRRRLAENVRIPRSVLPKLRLGSPEFSPESASVLFAHNSARESEIVRLNIGETFQFENLPSGFMSQITDDRLALLKAVSRRNG